VYFAALKYGLIELLESALRIVLCPKLDNSDTAGAALFPLENVRTHDIARLAHMILQVLPLGLEGEIADEEAPSLNILTISVTMLPHRTTYLPLISTETPTTLIITCTSTMVVVMPPSKASAALTPSTIRCDFLIPRRSAPSAMLVVVPVVIVAVLAPVATAR